MKKTNAQLTNEAQGVSRETEDGALQQRVELTKEEFITELEETIDLVKKMEETDEVKKKERKPNTIYTLKSFKEHINKLATYKVCTPEEVTQLRKIHKAATERWIGLTMEE